MVEYVPDPDTWNQQVVEPGGYHTQEIALESARQFIDTRVDYEDKSSLQQLPPPYGLSTGTVVTALRPINPIRPATNRSHIYESTNT